MALDQQVAAEGYTHADAGAVFQGGADDKVVQAGQRFGMIRFGSRVDLYLPLSSRITCKLGDRVRSGETVLGYFDTPATQDSVA